MVLTRYPIEGDIIETLDGHFFEIKGFDQPYPKEQKIVGFIRYFNHSIHSNPSNSSSKIEAKSKKKIISLKEKYELIFKELPHYLYTPPNLKLSNPLTAIPIEDIKTHYCPEIFLQQNLKKERINDPVLKACVDFCQFLSKNSGVSLKYFGITGSTLINLQNESSDIDIIIYGFYNSSNVRKFMRESFSQKSTKGLKFKPYNLSDLKELYKFRAKGCSISFYDFLKYEIRKLHQGIFNDKDYFIRFFNLPLEYKKNIDENKSEVQDSRKLYEENNAFYTQEIIDLGKIKISGEVRGDLLWWTTPAMVEIANITVTDTSELYPGSKSILDQKKLKIETIRNTFSLRGRYIENIRLLEHFKAYGSLELVIDSKNMREYLQISFGSSPTDFLIQS